MSLLVQICTAEQLFKKKKHTIDDDDDDDDDDAVFIKSSWTQVHELFKNLGSWNV